MDVGHASEFDAGDRNHGYYFEAGRSTEVHYSCPSAHNDGLDDCIGSNIHYHGKMTPSHYCVTGGFPSFLTRATHYISMAGDLLDNADYFTLLFNSPVVYRVMFTTQSCVKHSRFIIKVEI
jgi:hypothetical protein